MARLLPQKQKLKPSKAEAAGNALKKMQLHGYLGVVEAAAYLGIHKYTLREYIEKGFIQTFEIGARKYLDAAELQRVKGLLEKEGSLAKAFKLAHKENIHD